jgi:hypothetical protein
MIEREIEDLIRRDITKKGLVRTGRMRDSISVEVTSDGEIIVSAVEYFKYVDGNNNILNDVYSSNEFATIYSNWVIEQIEKNIDL